MSERVQRTLTCDICGTEETLPQQGPGPGFVGFGRLTLTICSPCLKAGQWVEVKDSQGFAKLSAEDAA